MASPGEDTQHDDIEREEREELTSVHLTGLYSFRAACTAWIVREPEQGAPVSLSDLVVGLSRHSLDGWSRSADVYLPPFLSFSRASCWAARLSITRR